MMRRHYCCESTLFPSRTVSSNTGRLKMTLTPQLAEAQVQVRHSRLHDIDSHCLRLRVSRCASRYEERSEMLIPGQIR